VKIFAHIMSLMNLLAGLAWFGVLLAIWPWDVTGFWPLGLLGLVVLAGQRLQARALAQGQPGYQAPDSPFQPDPGWGEGRLWPQLLFVGNIAFAVAVIFIFYNQYYSQLQVAMDGYNPHPWHYWLRGVLAFLALVVLANILFDLVCILDQWPRAAGRPSPLRRFVWGCGLLLLVTILGWNFRYALERGQVQARLAVWPQFETVTLADGQEVELTPPPGYIRVEPDQPDLQEFFQKRLDDPGYRHANLLAAFAADERAYEEIIKTLAAGARDYYCPDGLAWIEQAQPPARYTVDPDIPLNIAKGRSKTMLYGDPRYRLTSPAFYLRGQTHKFMNYEQVRESHLDASGEVAVAGRLLQVRTCDGVKGEVDEARLQSFLDNSRQWLEALSGWPPPEGDSAAWALGSDFLPGLRRNLLDDCEKPKFPQVTALAHDGRDCLLVGRATGEIEIWNVKEDKVERILPPARAQAVNQLSFTPDGDGFFAATDRTGSVQFRDSESGKLRQLIPTFKLNRSRSSSAYNLGPILGLGDDFPARYGTDLAESDSGQYWLSGSGTQSLSGLFVVPRVNGLFLFEARTGTLYPPGPMSAENGRPGQRPDHPGLRSGTGVLKACLSGWIDPRSKAESGFETGRSARPGDNRARPNPGKRIAGLKTCLSHWTDALLGVDYNYGYGLASSALAADRESGLVAVGTERGAIDLYRLRLINQIPSLELVRSAKNHHRSRVAALHFAPQGGKLYSVDTDGKIAEWSLPRLELISSRASGWHQIREAEFMPGSKFLALAGLVKAEGGGYDRIIGLIDLSTGRRHTRPMVRDSAQMEFIPSHGKLITVQGCTMPAIDIPDEFQ